MDDRERLRVLFVEFIGAFMLTFMGAGAIVATQGGDLVAIALAHGLAIGLMVMAAGHISGGHFNPAVTIGMWATRRIETNNAAGYIVAQLAGALAGAGVLTLTFRDIERNAVNMGVPAVGVNMSATNALVMEIVLTFLLMFVIFGTAVDGRTPKANSGLCIGLAITMDIFAGGGVSGAAMNPSRWFGVAVVQQDWSDAWVWWVGPIVGAILGALVFNDFLLGAGSTITDRFRDVDQDESEPHVHVEGSSATAMPRSRRAKRRH